LKNSIYICASEFLFINNNKKVFYEKSFFTFILIAGIAGTANGQFKLSLGPVVGMNYSFYSGTDIEATNLSYNGFGLALGGQLDMKFTPVVGLTTTITAFNDVSANGTVTTGGIKFVNALHMSYLMINPSLKFSVPSTGLGFLIGPGIGFNLQGSQESYNFQNGTRTQTLEKTNFPNLNPRIDANMGMVYDFDLGSVTLAPYFTFSYGLNKIAEALEVRVSHIQFGLACKFGLIK
jgi:hypothetical protein